MARTIDRTATTSSVQPEQNAALPQIDTSLNPASTAVLNLTNPVVMGLPTISQNMRSAQRSMKEIAALQTSLNYTNVGLQLADINNQKNNLSRQYLTDHPDGVGYSNYMMESYQKLLSERIDAAPNRAVQDTLKQHMMTALPALQDSTSSLELNTGRNYVKANTQVTLDSYLNQLVHAPQDAAIIKGEYAQALASAQGVLSPAEYSKYASKAWDKYGATVGELMIMQNPDSAMVAFKKGALSDVASPSTIMHLMKTAQHQSDSLQKRQLRDLQIQELQGNIQNVKEGLGYKKGTTPLDVMSSSLPDDMKARIIANLNEIDNLEKNKVETQQEIARKYQNEEPLDGYSSSNLNLTYRSLVLSRSMEKEAPISSEEKAWIAVNGKFPVALHDLERDLSIDLDRGSATDALSAANAMELINKSGKQTLIDNLPIKYQLMAAEIRENGIYAGSEPKRMKALVADIRDKYSKVNSEQIKFNNEAFAQEFHHNEIYGQIDSSLKPTLGGFGIYMETPSNIQSQLTLDAAQELRKAYRISGNRKNSVEVMNDALLKNWGTTEVAPAGTFIGSKMVMKYPPEKMYPAYVGTPYLKNGFYKAVEIIVRENERAFKEDSPVRLKKPLLRQYSSEEDWKKNDYTTTSSPIIEANVDGVWEERDVHIEGDLYDKTRYHAYWLYKKGNDLTKRYLKTSKETFASSIGF
jgi:hypothetical protein